MGYEFQAAQVGFARNMRKCSKSFPRSTTHNFQPFCFKLGTFISLGNGQEHAYGNFRPPRSGSSEKCVNAQNLLLILQPTFFNFSLSNLAHLFLRQWLRATAMNFQAAEVGFAKNVENTFRCYLLCFSSDLIEIWYEVYLETIYNRVSISPSPKVGFTLFTFWMRCSTS